MSLTAAASSGGKQGGSASTSRAVARPSSATATSNARCPASAPRLSGLVLNELRDSGRIALHGSGPGARWHRL